MEKQDNNYKQIEDNIIHTLKDIKQSYIKMKEQLDVSIRKDVVAVELKDILINNVDNYSLRSALETYIQNLYNINKEDTNNE